MHDKNRMLNRIPGFSFWTHTKICDNVLAFLMLLPLMVIFGIVIIIPILKGIIMSFCDYALCNMNNPTWNSFGNYRNIFKNWEVLRYLVTTLVYVSLTVLIQFVIGMGIALLMNTNVRGKRVWRGLFLVPWTIPSVVVAILWRWMLQEQFGVLNYLLHGVGITSSMQIAWTQSNGLAMASVVMAAIWRQLPYTMLMLLAGLQAVDHSLVEVATIDGAHRFQIFRHVTVPAIRPVIHTTIWISVLDNFQMFTIIFNMTGGGPVDATTTLSLATYKRAFTAYNFGQASAIGVIWMAFLVLASVYYNRMGAKYSSDYL